MTGQTPNQAGGFTSPVNSQPPAGPTGNSPISQDERNMAMLCHLLGFFGIIGPLVIWLIKKDESAFVDQQGKESVNFHITIMVITIPLYIILSILSVIPIIGWLLSIPFVLGLFGYGVFIVVQMIMASVKASSGVAYRYPCRFTFIQ